MWFGSKNQMFKSLTVAAVTILVVLVGCDKKSDTEQASGQPKPVAKREIPQTPQTSTDSAKVDTSLKVLRQSTGSAAIWIEEIVPNSRIRGRASGIASESAANYKILVYVHTDQWYIHPYAGQGEGRSWASLRPGLSWSISTVKRSFAADQVAALLVRTDATVPSTVQALDEIQSVAWIVIVGTGGL